MVRHVRCTFSRLVLVIIGITVSIILTKWFLTQTIEKVEHKDVHRHLESVPDKDKFVEIIREKPRVSFSMSNTFQKLLKEERMYHNHSRSNILKPRGSVPVPPAGASNLSSLKAHLKDPGFVNKIRDMEDKRQGLYLGILDKRGQIVKRENGGKTIVSYPQVPITFPNNLKKPLDDWSEKENIWLNITHFPWPLDSKCSKYSVTFAKQNLLPVVGLASYPSSGNTWLRYLLEGVTGYYTGSMYNDITLRKRGFYGEGVSTSDGLVVTVKTHGHTTEKGAHVTRPRQVEYNHHKQVNYSAILIIRNPFDAIIGHRNLDTGGHTGLAKMDQFVGDGWQEFVEIKSDSWLNFYSDWLENNPSENILVLHYENIQENLLHSLRKMLRFLGFEEDQGRIDCTQQFQTGQFKRKHDNDLLDDPFTEEQKQIVVRSILRLNTVLRKYRKETMPLRKYKHFNVTGP